MAMPDAVSRAKIVVIPKQVVVGLLQSSLSAPKLNGPCDGGQSAVRDSQIRFAVDAEPSDRPFINGFEVAMYYFQPSTIPPFGTWVRYPKIWDLDLQDGELTTQSTQSSAYMRSYGLQWRWRAAETNESRVGPFSEWCHFKLHDPLGIGAVPIASGAIDFDKQTSVPVRHIQ